MSDREDLNDIENLDDDFDYLKEIEEIEAQERELEEQRRRKKAELEKRREEREREAKKAESRKKREQKKESEWLGEKVVNDDVETVPVPKKKKNSRVALIMAIVVILILAAVGGVYAYKMQIDKKTIADFETKLTAFQSEKMKNVDFGSHQAYFDDFFQQCQAAIEDKDLSRIAALNLQWAEVESQYVAVSDGQTSLTAFASGVGTAFANYTITDTYKEAYDTLMKNIDEAKKANNYDQVADLQKQIDALTTNLKADNMKLVQNLKNDISAFDLDADYTSDEQKVQLKTYGEQVEKAVNEGNYKQAIDTLNGWKNSASAISAAITEQKRAEAAKAESEAAARRESESKARESESKAKESKEKESRAESESKAKETATTSTTANNNNNNNNSTASKGDYILANSNSTYLTAADVKNLSSYQLMIARNEIYARRGRKFADAELRNYFNSKSWYHGTIEPQDFSISVFNDYEIKNLALIQEYE